MTQRIQVRHAKKSLRNPVLKGDWAGSAERERVCGSMDGPAKGR